MNSLSRESRIVALVVAAAFFMQNLDSSIMNTSLPQMAGSFNVLPLDLSVGLTIYLLTSAALVPLSGWLADRFGARKVFIGAIGIFTGASLLCGAAHTLWQFALARALQGVGGALLQPVGRMIVLRNTEKSALLEAIAFITWPSLAAPVIGPALGGFITTYISWRWNFLLNIPLGILGIVLIVRYVPAAPIEHEHAFDWTGFWLSGTALVAMLYGLEWLSHAQAGWNAWQWLLPTLLTLLGVVFMLGSTHHFRRVPHPLLELSAFSIPTYRIMTLGAGMAFRLTTNATPYLLPLMFQVGFGMNALQAGSLLLVYFVGNLGIKPITSPVLHKFGFRNVLIVNGFMGGLSVMACALFDATTAKALILVTMFFAGATRSMQLTCINTLAFADTTPEQRSSSTTMLSMTTQVSAALGVAISTLAVNVALLSESAAAAGLREIKIGLVAIGLIGLVSSLEYFRLHADAGAEVSGHKMPGRGH